MSLLLLPKQYKDGQVLYKTALDAIVNSLLAFFNTQKLGNDNIQTGGLRESNLDSSASVLPVGAIIEWSLSVPPSGTWAHCNGASLTTAGHPALFAVTGYTFGGAGANFSLPDLRGRSVVGLASASSELTIVDPTVLGATGGNQLLEDHTHSAGTATVGPTSSGHTHDVTDPTHGHQLTFNMELTGGGAHPQVEFRHGASPVNCNSQDNQSQGGSFPGSSIASATVGAMAAETAHTHAVGGTSGSTGTGSHGAMQPVEVGDYIIRIS